MILFSVTLSQNLKIYKNISKLFRLGFLALVTIVGFSKSQITTFYNSKQTVDSELKVRATNLQQVTANVLGNMVIIEGSR